jgi:alkylation response protein AidB-like acyl-CoA dehydrogenase
MDTTSVVTVASADSVDAVVTARRRTHSPGQLDVAAVRHAVVEALPIIRAAADEGDRSRRLAAPVVDAFRASGLNRLLLPVELGGLDAPVADILDIVELIGTADGSSAWCGVIGTGSNLFAGYLPVEAARRVFADRDQGSATMLAPAGTLVPADGGFRLSGRWPFTSNCLHSDWIGLGAVHADEAEAARAIPDGPPIRLHVAFVPASAVRIDDTWDSSGLRATGSHHVALTDLEIPADQVCVFNGEPWSGGRLWRMPIASIYVPLLAAVTLGIARGAVDDLIAAARAGREARRGDIADDPVAMLELGSADARLRMARAGLHQVVAEAQVAADRQVPIDRAVQARVALVAHEAADLAVEAATTAHRIAGGAAAYRGNRILRALDDIHAARQHLMLARTHRPHLAKALVGLDTVHPPFVL